MPTNPLAGGEGSGMGWPRGFAQARRLFFLGQEFNARLRFKRYLVPSQRQEFWGQ